MTVGRPNTHPRRLTSLAESRGQPPRPFRPPRPLDPWRRLQPFVRSDIRSMLRLVLDLVEVALFARRRDDTCIVAAAGQKGCHVGVHLMMDLVGRLPGRAVVT